MTDLRDAERGKPALGPYFIIPLLASALTFYYFESTGDLVWEAKATGLFIGGILLALCITQFVRLTLRVMRGEGSLSFGELIENTTFNRQRLALIVLVGIFIASLDYLGTNLGLFLVLVACMWLMGVRDLKVNVSVALATSAVVYFLLIYLVGSQLPQGIFKHVFALAGAA